MPKPKRDSHRRGLNNQVLVAVAEADRDYLRNHSAELILASMRRAVADACDAPLATLVLAQWASVPKTSSGKVRRQACKQDYLAGRLRIIAGADVEVQANGATEHPGTDLNSQLLRDSLDPLPSPQRAELLTQFLIAKATELARLPETQLSPDRSLRAIGLDSLRVMELKHALERLLGMDVPISLLVSDRTVAELGYELAGQSAARGRVEERGRQEAARPLSHAQRLIWTVHQLDPDSIAYNLHLAFRLRKRLDSAVFPRALDHLLARHCGRLMRQRRRASLRRCCRSTRS